MSLCEEDVVELKKVINQVTLKPKLYAIAFLPKMEMDEVCF